MRVYTRNGRIGTESLTNFENVRAVDLEQGQMIWLNGVKGVEAEYRQADLL